MKKILQLKSKEYLLLFIFLLISALASYLSLQKIKEYDIHKTKTALISINKSSAEALHQWLRGRKENINEIAKNNYVLESTKKLLNLPQDSVALASSETIKDLRIFFTPILNTHEDLGSFIISPDYRSVFSMRNENIGTYNLIAEQNKNLLDQVFTKGKTLLIPPIKSDVPLSAKYGNISWETMFIATPIIDNGHIIAVLTFRIDTKKDFSRILEIGAIGETGETYAYNKSGKIISKTRFHEGLQERLDLSIPNSNENDKDLLVIDTVVKVNYDITETNKFEKKDVYKVSQWDEELGIGLITKINKREALESYFFVRTISIGLFIGIGVLVFLLLNVIVSQRQEKQKNLENTKKELETLVLTRTKELDKTIASKNKFFSILAHDLKGPFGSLVGLLEMLVNDPKSFSEDERNEITKQVYSSSLSLFKLLENLLTWSRAQTKNLEIKLEKLNILDLVNDCADLKKLQLKNKNIELVTAVSAQTFAYADKNSCSTVLRNLLSNAIKFTNLGGTIKIKSSIEDKQIKIIIEDNGVGMSEKQVSTLFHVDKTTSTKGTNNESGTGLGLAICKDFVELNNGTLSAESEISVGSRFIIKLPLA
ncbi:HAMP domain-containing histidine kinase [Polaribacter litorisediminis]|uniref:sensor histidine kinase n=1 Tax=Polaribacter litorisediminis TaxID=1908341 RepID=UPI001CBF0781|nr:HAMP domain-containing sensor histidine kinase [Polaribacter litorisediminis]UAM98610.1 HAMP domain-containing histidine kinase [Polaribacter litorisediminis]